MKANYTDKCLEELDIEDKRYAGYHNISFKISRLEGLVDSCDGLKRRIAELQEDLCDKEKLKNNARAELRKSEQGKVYLENRKNLRKKYY